MNINDVKDRINYLTTNVSKSLKGISEEKLSFKPTPEKWSQKEILGHLCDSAINNLSRFIRAQHEPKPFAVIGYDQDAWVAAAHYQDMSVDEVLGFWQSANRNIVTVISFYTPEELQYECYMKGEEFGNYTKQEIPEYKGPGGMRTLHWLIDDYAAHMEYHLKQIPGVFLSYRIGFITYDLYPNLLDSEREFAEFAKISEIIIEPVNWRDKSVDYSKFDLIVIRTCWDYFIRYDEFLEWLKFLKEQNVKVLNSLNTIYQNIHKYYLRDLQAKAVKILDTVFIDKNSPADLKEIFHREKWNKAVVKPAVSGGGYKTHLISDENIADGQKVLDKLLSESDVLLQKFAPEIISAGEWSLIFFDKKYSHSVLKMPKKNDFRVQAEHGGSSALKAAPEEIVNQAASIIDKVNDDLLYARVDGVVVSGEFRLMELELIEPELFLLNEGIMKRFRDAIIVHLKK